MARRELGKLKMATRKIGALQEAKEKLEEKGGRTHLASPTRKKFTASKSPKHKRYRNYRNSLQDMQSKLNETNALLVKERECSACQGARECKEGYH
ncbi:myosin-11 [Arachis duranensis]|uniref:Myosin-11 n=1 Tax=Arachis duranensis TaxID=130453 RepID=A0A9C6WUD3_ARADU|nr:myosin-11 [Arachis duranensis]